MTAVRESDGLVRRQQVVEKAAMGCAVSKQTKVTQPNGPTAAEIEAAEAAEVARLEKLVAETGGAARPSQAARKRGSSRKLSRAEKMVARAADAKLKKTASLEGHATVASRLIALRAQARKNIVARNQELVHMAPLEVSSESEEEANAHPGCEDAQPVRLDTAGEPEVSTERSRSSLAGGDSLRAAEVDLGGSQTVG